MKLRLLEDGKLSSILWCLPKMFSPNGNYGRLKVDRAVVFNNNLNRITDNRFIRGGHPDARSLEGAVLLRDAAQEGYIYQRPGTITSAVVNSAPPQVAPSPHGHLGIHFITAFKGGFVEEFTRQHSFFRIGLTINI